MPLPLYGIPPFIIKLKIEGKVNDTLLKNQESTNSVVKTVKKTALAADIASSCHSDEAVSKQGSCVEKCIEGQENV